MAHDEQKIARAIQLARDNIQRGIIREPRVYFDEVAMPTSITQIAYVDTDVFRNGEEYPVRIHAITAGIITDNADDNSVDERQIQRIGMRIMAHDHYYMQREFTPLPLWQTKCVAAAPALSFGQSAWQLHAPFVYSSRDSMDIRAQINSTPDVSRDVTFAMTGIGMDSMRPYFKADTVTFTEADAPSPFDPENLRNDGDEPIIITDVTVHCGADAGSNNPQGNIRQCDISIRQVGNGTQAVWMNGAAGTDDLCPAILLGLTTGRALVHEFPGEGLLWEPGEGLRIEFQPLNAAAADATIIIGIGIIGTIEVR